MLAILNYGERKGRVVDLPPATVAVMLQDGRALPYSDLDVEIPSAAAPVVASTPAPAPVSTPAPTKKKAR